MHHRLDIITYGSPLYSGGAPWPGLHDIHHSPQASRLPESTSLFTYPDSRPLYPKIYNPPIPHLHSVFPQGHDSAISSAATPSTFVDDREGMNSLPVLHIHTAAHPNEGGQGLAVALEESCMRENDAAVDDITQGQSQPNS